MIEAFRDRPMKSLTNVVLRLTVSLIFAFACSSSEPTKQEPVACQSDDDCAQGHCDPKSGCVACVFDAHCADGQRCASGSCYTPTPCSADDDCSADGFPVCDPGTHECVPCLSDEQCGDSAHCRDGGCVAYEKCATEKDCRNDAHCDLGSGECVACLSKGDCAAGNDCVKGECRVGCETEADCSANDAHCTSAGYCGECANDAHCPDVYHCQAGACVRDVCEQGKSRCAEDGASVGTCSANGDGLLMSGCAAGQSCDERSDAAACKPWLCVPSSTRCGSDGASLETCAADGLSVVKNEACADGQRCVAGRCATLGCEPNAAFCKDGNSYTCSFDGTDSALTRVCEANERCEEATGKCLTKLCTPGAKICQQRDLGTCRADGSGYDYAACDANEACVDGQCQALTCAPSSRFCSGNDLRVCDANGTGSTKEATCSKCVTSGEYAYCSVASCTPGTALCDGSRATVCAQDGNGPEPNGDDCAAVDAYCELGVCHPYLCTPLARSCQGEYMYQCSSDGKSLNLYDYYACNSYYWSYSHCNPANGQCQAQTCTPSSKYCSNGVAYACDATGFVATAGENCVANGKVCSQGACVAQTCTPGSYFCKGGNPYYCSDGISTSQQDTCTASEYCLEGYYNCQPDACTPGKPICNGNAVSTCAADGSGPMSSGTNCGANQACADGACAAVTCNANSLVCLNGHVQLCNASGTSASLYQYCVAETYCDATTFSCKPDVCPAGKAYCDAETLKACKADGSSSVDAGTVCSANGKVCTTTGCVDTAVESLGTGTTTLLTGSASDYIAGDVLKVSQQRKLTKMELRLAVSSGPLDVHWVVYSSSDNVTFYQVSDIPASIPDTTEAWVSSGDLNLTLESGLYYLLGVELAPTGSLISHYSSALSTPALSFAKVTGSVTQLVAGAPASFKPDLSTTKLHYIRLSTALP